MGYDFIFNHFGTTKGGAPTNADPSNWLDCLADIFVRRPNLKLPEQYRQGEPIPVHLQRFVDNPGIYQIKEEHISVTMNSIPFQAKDDTEAQQRLQLAVDTINTRFGKQILCVGGLEDIAWDKERPGKLLKAMQAKNPEEVMDIIYEGCPSF